MSALRILVRVCHDTLLPGNSPASDVATNLLVRAAVVHGTPTTTQVLGLIKKQPRAPGALLDSGQLCTGDQIAGGQAIRTQHDVQPRHISPLN